MTNAANNAGKSKGMIYLILLLLGAFLLIGFLKSWIAAGIFIGYILFAYVMFLKIPDSIFYTGPVVFGIIAYIAAM
jgi:hypothetical protein